LLEPPWQQRQLEKVQLQDLTAQPQGLQKELKQHRLLNA
jgi:hypothetical protein